MAQSKSSKKWLREHFDDHYVKEAQKLGYRSRACFKLLEIQEKDKIIKPGMTVVDLGSAPGGWSQVAAELVGDHGRVVASDILPMDGLAGVEFVQGDFTEEAVFEQILGAITRPRSPTSCAATCDQPPGALPRSTTVMPGRISFNATFRRTGSTCSAT